MDSCCAATSLKFLCSYGGKILPRHTDDKLRYVGGVTRVLAVDRYVSFAELMVKLGEFCGSSVTLRCQLPKGDLETLISITSEEDLANLIEEYDRASISLSHPMKIRAILSPQISLKQISSPPSSAPSVRAVASLPNSPQYRFAHGTSSPPHGFAHGTSSPPHGFAHGTSSPPYRITNRTSSPPIGYQFGFRNCSRRTCSNACHFAGSQRMLYSAPHTRI